jgi:hypothetical protein
MANPKRIVQPKDLPARKTHSQVVTVTGGTLIFIAGMTSRSEIDASLYTRRYANPIETVLREYRPRPARRGW